MKWHLNRDILVLMCGRVTSFELLGCQIQQYPVHALASGPHHWVCIGWPSADSWNMAQPPSLQNLQPVFLAKHKCASKSVNVLMSVCVYECSGARFYITLTTTAPSLPAPPSATAVIPRACCHWVVHNNSVCVLHVLCVFQTCPEPIVFIAAIIIIIT